MRLGVTASAASGGLHMNLRASADAFFDAQDLFDLRIQSTLGLTDDDVDALAAIDGVEAAEGGWVEPATPPWAPRPRRWTSRPSAPPA